ncbi:TlpA disulfide reductase family protein [Bacteroides helcogenes]|uniref:Alkyl hydroperoxide reductase/ Thiol specific antioxidant/ Mal allergen n=1 Tax=Bacteroides helcogenes (strain ATCC 35417 / DSM 20613 / JCM 6297 / CCUG 15421 / P 36-108) TaxID=693979 RepID=E6SPV3_BACT6|nr:TlpA disulfide reductase family protein [Bacteroides helcogenes]ADV44932.1 alkyl hydroperoxide reductase/ Thiol specific antioxidant/ Mal allergen [Bacteroides helcogenes P 36-108]MDY5239789.1 TlpA disulfide reductase family protein [Bacteroides helcogenes]
MKKILLLTMVVAFAACNKTVQNNYVIAGTAEGSNDGDTIYLAIPTRTRIDTTTITDGKFKFKGVVDSITYGYLMLGSSEDELEMSAIVLVEKGNITVQMRQKGSRVSGTENNDKLYAITDKLNPLKMKIREASQKLIENKSNVDEKTILAIMQPLTDEYNAAFEKAINENKNSIIEDMIKAIYGKENSVDYPTTIKESRKRKIEQQNTAIGKMFADFTIENGTLDGKKVSLSNYVGKGKYILVDFWASWCGPCRAEIPNIKKAYEKYKGKNFDVLSVAVWDERNATLKAIKEEKLQWNQIIDGGDIPTEIYGIEGIPTIILFAPDGTVAARDIRGEEISQTLMDILEKQPKK